jgi:DNA (cytosine-5)-methyltransferase 1
MAAIARSIKEKMFDRDNNGKAETKRKSYVEILNDAWQEHLKPRESNAPTVISTFAGCGGSSLGYSIAGYRELLAVEWDNNAVETFIQAYRFITAILRSFQLKSACNLLESRKASLTF